MHLTAIHVEAAADEEATSIPQRLQVAGRWVEVGEILDRWYQGVGNPEWPPADYFKVICYDFKEYLLKHDLEADDWFLISPHGVHALSSPPA